MNAPLRDAAWAACFICGDPGYGMGWKPKEPWTARHKWLCDDGRCLFIAPEVYKMPSREMRIHAQEALEIGGQEAGKYLETIGKTDLADLTREEWLEFLDRFLKARADAIRRLAATYCPPF